eukprot:3941529-Rhodomonas_salina.2
MNRGNRGAEPGECGRSETEGVFAGRGGDANSDGSQCDGRERGRKQHGVGWQARAWYCLRLSAYARAMRCPVLT